MTTRFAAIEDLVCRAADTADSVSRVSDGVGIATDLARRARAGAGDAWHGASYTHASGVTSRYAVASAQYARANRRRAAIAWVAYNYATGHAPSPASAARRGAIPGSGFHPGTRTGDAGFHPDGDRERALRQLDRAYEAFRTEVEPRATGARATEAMRQWWQVDVLPTLTDWTAFRRQAADSWATRFTTEWSVFVGWRDQLRVLRSTARILGLPLASPEPAPLPETSAERVARGRGGLLETLWTTCKVILYAGVGVVGVLSLRNVWRDAKVAKDQLLLDQEVKSG